MGRKDALQNQYDLLHDPEIHSQSQESPLENQSRQKRNSLIPSIICFITQWRVLMWCDGEVHTTNDPIFHISESPFQQLPCLRGGPQDLKAVMPVDDWGDAMNLTTSIRLFNSKNYHQFAVSMKIAQLHDNHQYTISGAQQGSSAFSFFLNDRTASTRGCLGRYPQIHLVLSLLPDEIF